MKNLLSFATSVVLCFLAACSSNAADNKYTLTIQFPDNSADGKEVTLTNYDTGDTLATAKIANGAAQFTGTVNGSIIGRVLVDSARPSLIIEGGDITLDMKTGDSHGTPLNEQLTQLGNSLNATQEKANEIGNNFKSGKLTDAEASKQMESLEVEYYGAINKAFEENKDNALGFFAFLQMDFDDLTAEEFLAKVASTSDMIKNSARVKKMLQAKEAVNITAIGQKFVDFTIIDEKGNKHSLSDYVGKGHWVLIDFWASWCGPCRREMKTLKELYASYKDKGLEIVGFAVWDKPEDTWKAVDQLKLPWEIVSDCKAIPTDLYGVNGIPHVILFDPEGTIVARGLQGEDLKAKVAEHIK